MCLVLIAHEVLPELPLVVAANRDEFHERGTMAAHWWEDEPILAGRDREAGGTWFGVNRHGVFATVTNYRDPSVNEPGLPSRGQLPVLVLRRDRVREQTVRTLHNEGHRYNGFNLLFGQPGSLHYVTNRGESQSRLRPGLYGLSNHVLETAWPKVQHGKALLQEYLDSGRAPEHGPLLDLLHDRSRPDDDHLPNTGIGLEWERLLAPMFIVSRRYGTRASTVLTVDRQGRAAFTERTFDWRGNPQETRSFEFALT